MADNELEPTSDVVILGGGIAGISAALDLLDSGYTVTLVETRKYLGGRSFSFSPAYSSLELDNGQHIICECCPEFIGFLERLGARDRWFVQDRLNVSVFSIDGKRGDVVASRLPAPLHLLPSIFTYPHLSLSDKLRVLAGIVRAWRANRDDAKLKDITFYQWLVDHGQSERAINNFWNLAVKPAFNDSVGEVSADMGLMLVQVAMLASVNSGNVGYPTDGLLASLGEPARRRLEERGATLLLEDAVRKVAFSPSQGDAVQRGSVSAVELASGRRVAGRQFVSALPWSALLRLLPPAVAEQDFFAGINRLEWAPIVNLHIHYDRPIMSVPFCAFVDSPVEWVFNRNVVAGIPLDGGQWVSITLCAAWEYADMTREELGEMFVAEMAKAFPAAAEAKALKVVVVKQRESTFRCPPGVNRWRPGPVTPVANLFLAGDWTDTGWPATMEGAVRSGQQAARALSRA